MVKVPQLVWGRSGTGPLGCHSTAARKLALPDRQPEQFRKATPSCPCFSVCFLLCHPLLLLPSTFPCMRVFSNESVLHIRWRKYWSFSFSISPSNDYSGLISFRIDWFDLLAVQGTLKSLLQHHSSKASIIQCSACFMVQLSHPYMTTGKTIAFTRQTFVSKVMSLSFNMLSSLVIVFLPRSKYLLISAVTICSDFGAQENKVSHCFHCFPRSRCFSGTLLLS